VSLELLVAINAMPKATQATARTAIIVLAFTAAAI
jgi:hypothetical protein